MLFDGLSDPGQLTNLVDRSKSAVLQARLEEQLQRKLAKEHDAFLPAKEYIDHWGYRVDANGTVPYAP